MKRSFPINLAGRVFYIDEDAYSMLDNYLSNLTITFGAEDDREIVIDIENRISEILYERIGSDSASRPISMPDVEHVIDVIGSPEQVADNDSDFTDRSNDENSYSRGNNSETTPPPFYGPATTRRRRLYRDPDDKVLAGVVSGLCLYCNWSVTPARIILVIAALCFPVLMLAYLLAWLFIPLATTAEERLEMSGSEVNIDSIGQKVKDTYTARRTSSGETVTINSFISILAKLGLGFITLIALPVALATLVMILVSIVGLVAGAIVTPIELMSICDRIDVNFVSYFNEFWVLLVWCAVAFIPALLIVWAACSVFFKAPSMSRGLALTLCIMEIILIVVGIIISTMLNL